jgi:hypothetical protein
MGIQIDVQPLVLKDVRVRVGVDNYEKHISSVIFTPASSTQTWQGGTPDASFTDTTTPTWTVACEFAQDWETDDSFAQYLFEHAGETKEFEFAPQSGVGKKTFSSNVAIQSGAIGGAIGAYATSSVTMGCDKPVIGLATLADEPVEDGA